MSDDGADLGMTAEDGMHGALGDETVNEEATRRTPTELLAEIRADQGNTYSGCANRAALAILELFEARPEAQDWPAMAEGTFYVTATGERATQEELRSLSFDDMEFRPTGPDLYEVVKKLRPDLYDDVFTAMTGFQWGWAVNAAKYIVGAPPVPNPAIIEIG
ncbi:MAG: hypothetical protein LC798_19670 [Chloroflexi bacterium]|nr:hypothetical protein [Chloroflexota bacterium]